MKYLPVLAVAVTFGVLRFVVPVEGKIDHADVFKDLAHLFVGGCFGAAIYARSEWRLWAIAVGLTVLEVVAFFVRAA